MLIQIFRFQTSQFINDSRFKNLKYGYQADDILFITFFFQVYFLCLQSEANGHLIEYKNILFCLLRLERKLCFCFFQIYFFFIIHKRDRDTITKFVATFDNKEN